MFACGNCDGGAPCNAVDGTCSSGCAPGWTGNTCNEGKIILTLTVPISNTDCKACVVSFMIIEGKYIPFI